MALISALNLSRWFFDSVIFYRSESGKGFCAMPLSAAEKKIAIIIDLGNGLSCLIILIAIGVV